MRNDFCTDYLAHSAKGKTWQNHKYIAKHPLGNGFYKYFYTQAELDAFLKKKSGAKVIPSSQIGAKNYDPNAPKQTSTLSASPSNTAAVKQSLSSKNTTTNANKKTASQVTLSETKDKQATGKAAAEKLLSQDSSSTKKKGSGSGKSSSKDSTKNIAKGKGKSGSSSGSKKSGSGSSKEKSSGTKATKEKAEKTTTTKKQAQDSTPEKIDPITIDSLKKAYGSDTETFNGSASEFKSHLLEKYDDGAFGYLSAGSKVYKFVIEDGDVILKEYGSNREVSFDNYLKSVKSYQEFQANKKKN